MDEILFSTTVFPHEDKSTTWFCSPLNKIELYDLNKSSLFVSFTMVANYSATIVLIIWQSSVYCFAICLPIALASGAWSGFFPPFGLGFLSLKP
jgi:hypothetical protein